MDSCCPNCGASLGPDGRPADRVACHTCSRVIHAVGPFPLVVAMTFPSQHAEPIPLRPLFLVETSRLPAELADLSPAEGSRLGAVGHLPSQPPIGEPQLASPPPPALSTHSVALANPSEPEPPEARRLLSPTTDASVAAPSESPSFASQPANDEILEPEVDDDSLQILSLAGGSFAAALTPPPVPSKAPALAKIDSADDQWSVGPPPIAPPPVPGRNREAHEFALALGLPELQDREPEPGPIAEEASSESVEPEIDERATKPKSGRVLMVGVAALLLIVAGVGFAMFNAPREEQKPRDTKALDTTTRVAASLPSGDKKTDKADKKDAKTSAASRAQAIEHYNKGNKLYLQRKFPQALAEFKRALEVDKAFAYAHRGLGVTYAVQGKSEQAIEAYRAYLRLAPDAKDARQVEMLIKNFEK